MPLLAAILPAKLGSLAVAWATPISGWVRVRLPPAAPTIAPRLAGRLPLAPMMYDSAAAAPAGKARMTHSDSTSVTAIPGPDSLLVSMKILLSSRVEELRRGRRGGRLASTPVRTPRLSESVARFPGGGLPVERASGLDSGTAAAKKGVNVEMQGDFSGCQGVFSGPRRVGGQRDRSRAHRSSAVSAPAFPAAPRAGIAAARKAPCPARAPRGTASMDAAGAPAPAARNRLGRCPRWSPLAPRK
jgi:hypothetical protein